MAWWLVLLGISTVVVYGTERIARRFMPLATLYRLPMLFPGKAPTRRRVAKRASRARTLEEEIAVARERGVEADPSQAAETVLALAAALSSHDRRTRGHSERVRSFAEMIGSEMSLPQRDLHMLRWAALLHDIGKLRVSQSTLNKPNKLSEAEWEEIRRHPEHGVELLGPLRVWLGEWTGAVLHHHERFDGTGYPHRIAGARIALGARIVAVADAYETMTAPRPYRSALPVEAARKELAACAGSHFDPAVVRAFLGVSARRLRWTIGPLSWLAQFPALTRSLQTVAERTAGAVSTGAAVGTLAIGGTLVPPAPALPREPQPPAAARPQVFRPAGESAVVPSPTPSPTPTTSASPGDPPPTSGPTAPPSPSPSPVPTPREIWLYLRSSGPGDVETQHPLPLHPKPGPATQLPNYDAERNDDPGLTLIPSALGESEENPRKHQTWVRRGPIVLAGSAGIQLYSAIADFQIKERGSVIVALKDCDQAGSCRTIGTASMRKSLWASSPEWVRTWMPFGKLSATIAAGRSLVVHLTVEHAESTTMWFAYGTASHQSALKLTVLS